ncbi:restriction endonuclease subunit S [Mycoplasma sp. 4463]|uniref:restriction endonuclease subunit S n=1 Tax=Mycoplasma sp. 4463 TaxID=3400998 RepID=UPI003AB0C6D3
MKNENQTNFSIENFLSANDIKNVQIKKLYEVTIWSKSFANFDKTKLLKSEINYKSILSKEVKELVVENGDIKLLTTYPSDMFTSTDIWDGDVYEEEIVYIPSGGNPYVQYYNGKFINAGNIIGTSYDKNVLLTKYVYYFLKSKNDLIAKVFRGSGIKHPYMPEILEIEIPIPSIEVQTQVVNILDIFSSYAEKLKAELKAELKARSTQYEYYRDKLLSNNNLSNDINFFSKKLSEIAEINIGKQPSKEDLSENGLYPYMNGGISKSSNAKNFNNIKNTIIVSQGGSNAGYVQWMYEDFYQGSHCYSLKVTSKQILNRFLFFYLKSNQDKIFNLVQGSGIPGLKKTSLSSLTVLIPSIRNQEKIVKVLDNFESICKDLKIGLPAEEIKRQQQYEFYRNSIFEYLETNSFEKLMCVREREDNLTTGLIKLIQYIFDQTISLKLSKLIQFTNGFNFLTNANFDDSKPAASIIKIANIDKNNNLNINNAEKFNFSSYPNNDLSKYKVNKNCILIAMSGNTIGKTYYSTEELNCYINQRVGKIETQLDIINLKFIYFYLNNIIPNWIKQFYLKSSQPNINTSDIFDIEVKVPSLEKQNKIVNTLENFESICKDLKIGLPAEEIKRQQQYEFYRNSIFEYLETNSFEKLMRERERERR